MNAYTLRYTLRNGARGVLTMLASSSCAAVITAIDLLGDQLRTCSCCAGLTTQTPQVSP